MLPSALLLQNLIRIWHRVHYVDTYRSVYVIMMVADVLAPYRRQVICKPSYWHNCIYVTWIKLTIIASDNGLSPGRRQAIIRTNVGILLIEPLRTNFSEISIEIHTFSFKEMHLKMPSGKWRRPFCLGLNVLILCYWRARILRMTTFNELVTVEEQHVIKRNLSIQYLFMKIAPHNILRSVITRSIFSK